MIYSAFDDVSGLYDYYEGPGDLPVNADLPVPKLPQPTGGIGVPAIVAGRPLPAGSRHVGRGWHARGIVVQKPGKGLGEATGWSRETYVWLIAAIAGVWVTYRVGRSMI